MDTDVDEIIEANDLHDRMTWKSAPWFAWDLETTGPDPRTDRPLQYGYASQADRDAPIITGEVWINPERKTTDDFLQLTPEELEGIRIAPTFKEHAPYIASTFLREKVLMGWNCGNRFDPAGRGFDCPMFAMECQRVGRVVPTARVIDGMAIACQVVTPRPEKWTLAALAKHFDISFPSQAHRAGADAFVTLSIMQRMVKDLPDDLDKVHELVDRWVGLSWWLRETPRGLEVNCGKHQGMLLKDLALQPDRYGKRGGYLRWALGLGDLPEAVRGSFEKALEDAR